tara:strand:+ start:155 stop:457 length:303 start_codon:yes stop_codon:yes gene_type:complete
VSERNIDFKVMRDTDKYVYFWNVVFNTRRNPDFTGKHVNASVNRIHTTFSIETKQEDMIELFKAQTFNAKWKNGDVHEILGIHNIFEDRSEKGRFHKDNY